MADNFRGAAGLAGDTFAADEIAGVKYPRTKLSTGNAGSAADVGPSNPLPVVQTGPLTVTLANGAVVALDTPTLAALALAVEARLRAAPLDVTGALTDTQLRAAAVAVTGGLTDAQLRAAAVPVSLGAAVALDSATLAALEAISLNPGQTVSLDPATIAALLVARAVTGPLTDAELRATPVPVSIAGGGGGMTGPAFNYRLSLAASDNAGLIKASPGSIHRFTVQNTSSVIFYFKLYNTANTPKVGTTVPTGVWAVYPAQTLEVSIPGGRPHSTGIAMAATAGAADNSTASVVAGSLVNVDYS